MTRKSICGTVKNSGDFTTHKVTVYVFVYEVYIIYLVAKYNILFLSKYDLLECLFSST